MVKSKAEKPHGVVYNPKGQPVKCHKTDKAKEKAKADVAKLDGYRIKETPAARCPVCNPPKQEPQAEELESGHAPETVTLSEPGDEIKPWDCHNGCKSRKGQFTLKIYHRVLVRICKDCGGIYDLEKCQPWEG